MGKNIVILALVIVAIIASILIFMRGEPITNYPTQGGPVVAFGDSLVTGVGSSEGHSFVSLISKGLGEEILNMGISGDTTASGLARIDEVVKLKPRMTILVLGGNDFLRETPREETFNNLRSIIGKLQDAGSVVVLVGVRGSLISDNAASEYKKLASETRSVYVADILSGLFGDKKYMWDPIHPNDAGYEKIAQRMLPIIKKYSK